MFPAPGAEGHDAVMILARVKRRLEPGQSAEARAAWSRRVNLAKAQARAKRAEVA